MNIGDNIRKKRKEKGMTLEELSKIVGVSRQTISRYENNIIAVPYDKIIKLAIALGCSPVYLLGLAADNPLPKNLIPLNLKRIPILGEIACGEPIWAEQTEGIYVDADEAADADFALLCKGDSMVGDDIHDGDYVLIRRQPQVENGEIACVLIEDEATLKHFYYSEGVVTLVAANQKYPPMVFSGPVIESIRILGKAVGLTRFF